MNFSQFLSILKARWVSASLVLIITIGTAVTLSLLLPKQFTATAAVVVDVKTPDPIAGMAFSGMLTPGYMATQVDILTSDRVARRVVQGLHLTEQPDLRSQWQKETNGVGNIEAWIADLLRKNLEIKPARDSNVMTVQYTATNPQFAAGMANAFVQAYVDTTLDLRVQPAKQYSAFFEERAKELRLRLEKAQSDLSTYQKEHGILATEERLDIENQRLNELVSQLVNIQSISAESNSRNAQAKNNAELQDVINNPVVGALRADISRQEARLQELSAKYGDAHPQVDELTANIQALRQRIDTETRRIGSSVNVTNNINKRREADIRGALDAQRTKVIKIREQRDQLSVLMRDVETAQRSYDAVAQKVNTTTLESQANQTNISILTPATEPATHSAPKLALNVILAVILGILLAVGTAMLRELADRRVRSVTDLSQTIGLPVLGQLRPGLRNSLAHSKTPFALPSNVLSRLPQPMK